MLKIAAYAQTLQGIVDLKNMGFKDATLHPMLLPGISKGILPNEKTITLIKKSLEDNEIKPVDLSILGGWDELSLSGKIYHYLVPSDPEYEESRKKGVNKFKELVKLCKNLGCDQITTELGGHPVYRLDHEEAWKKSIKDIGPILHEEGVKLAFYPHPGDFLMESDLVVDLIREIKRDEIGYVYCVPHTYILAGKYDANPSAMIEYASDILMGVQLADSLKPIQMWVYQHREIYPYHNHLLPGKGMIDIKEVLKTLEKINFTGPITLIPYLYGMYPTTLAEVQLEAKKYVEKMISDIY
ncbi:MAG: sugar phosphate isomerase/epimerase family protein [Candidatus Hodarchaeota archaeon]